MGDALLIDDVLTPEEAAKLLKMDLGKLMKLIKRGEIPARRVARGDYRLMASVIRKWFEECTPNTFDPNRRAGEILGEMSGKKKTRI